MFDKKKYMREYNQRTHIKKLKKQWSENNPEYMKQYQINKIDKIKERERSRLYRKNNPEKVKEATKQWCRNNRLKINKYIRTWRKVKRETDIKYNLNNKMSCAIWKSLKSNKNGKRWEDLVGYTLDNLIKRIKETMPIYYTWQDFLQGRLHIDHITPKSAFNYDKSEQVNFKKCWSLENLRLLPARDNKTKYNKLEKPLQLAFKI